MDFTSILDALGISPANAAPAPQPAPDQAPIDDLMLKQQIAQRMREAFARGVGGDQSQQPANLPQLMPKPSDSPSQDAIRMREAGTYDRPVAPVPSQPGIDPSLPRPNGGWQTSVENAPRPAPAPIQQPALFTNDTSAFTGSAVPQGATVTPGRLAQEAPQPQSAPPAQNVPARPSAAPGATSQPTAQPRSNPFDQGPLGMLGDLLVPEFAASQRKRAGETATYNALMKQDGMTPDLAMAMTQNAGNPAVASLIASTLSPKTQIVNGQLIDMRHGKVIADFRNESDKSQAPHVYERDGEKFTAPFNVQVQGDVIPQTGEIMSGPNMGRNYYELTGQRAGQPVQAAPTQLATQQPAPAAAQTQPLPVSTPTPNLGTQGQPQATSTMFGPGADMSDNPYAVAPAPPGVDRQKWRQAEADRINKLQEDDRMKGEGSVDFIKQMDSLRGNIAQNGHVIGRYAEPKDHPATGPNVGWASDALNAAGALPAQALQSWRDFMGSGGNSDEPGTYAADNRARDVLKQDMTKAAQAGLKATYGNRILQIDVQQQQKTAPSLTDQDSKTSLDKINKLEQTSWQNIQRGINTHTLNPLSPDNEDVIVRGLSEGKIHLNPQTVNMIMQHFTARGAQ